jgi:hypothetical protein
MRRVSAVLRSRGLTEFIGFPQFLVQCNMQGSPASYAVYAGNSVKLLPF